MVHRGGGIVPCSAQQLHILFLLFGSRSLLTPARGRGGSEHIPEQEWVEPTAGDHTAATEDRREDVAHDASDVKERHHVETDVIGGEVPRGHDAGYPHHNHVQTVRHLRDQSTSTPDKAKEGADRPRQVLIQPINDAMNTVDERVAGEGKGR